MQNLSVWIPWKKGRLGSWIKLNKGENGRCLRVMVKENRLYRNVCFLFTFDDGIMMMVVVMKGKSEG